MIGFLDPALLWGLGAAALPLLIHLFFRRRPRPLAFPAFEFVLRARRQTERRLKLRKLLLFLARTLVLAAVALALARPRAERPEAAAAVASGPAATVILLDASGSMNYRLGGDTLFERGRREAVSALSRLGNEEPVAAAPCEILPSREFYDYEDKYLLDKARTLIPPNLPEETIQEVRRLAVACFLAVECSGMGRVDFLIEKATGKVFINEINTIPGFTSISMYPKMWEHDGLSFAALVERLIELALERHALRQSLRYEL